MKTKEEVKELCNAIANVSKVELTDDQKASVKDVVLQATLKSIANEVVTTDESKVVAFFNKSLQVTVKKAESFAETEAAKQLAEAQYQKDLQQHVITINDLTKEFIKTFLNGKKDVVCSFESKDQLKEHFTTFLKGLPVEPKKPNTKAKKESSESSGSYDPDSYKNPKLCENIVEGSLTDLINKGIPETGISEKDLLTNLMATSGKTEGAIRVAIKKCLNGKLLLTVTDGKIYHKVAETETK